MSLCLIAGETSGDQHAAALIRALKKHKPDLSVFGLGGPCMQEAGCELLRDMMDLAVMGFVEVAKRYGQFRKVFDQSLQMIEQRKPQAVIFVDYPGFNLRLAKKLQGKGIKLMYYITPQVWAWNKKRLAQLKTFDLLIPIFPFEPKFFQDHGASSVVYAGHPLIDDDLFAKAKPRYFEQRKGQIGLLPGSRVTEVRRLLPVMDQYIQEHGQEMQFVIPVANEACHQEVLNHWQGRLPNNVQLRNNAHQVMIESDFLIVASGTASFEAALLGVPMVIIYKIAPLTYAIAKWIVDVPHIGMANLIAQKRIVPELVQKQVTVDQLHQEVQRILGDPQVYNQVVDDLLAVRKQLGEPGVCDRVAQKICEVI